MKKIIGWSLVTFMVWLPPLLFANAGQGGEALLWLACMGGGVVGVAIVALGMWLIRE